MVRPSLPFPLLLLARRCSVPGYAVEYSAVHVNISKISPLTTASSFVLLPSLAASVAERTLVVQARQDHYCRRWQGCRGVLEHGFTRRGAHVRRYAGENTSSIARLTKATIFCAHLFLRLLFSPKPTLIPPAETIEDVRLIDDSTELEFVLVIEKDVSRLLRVIAPPRPWHSTLSDWLCSLSFSVFVRPSSKPSALSSSASRTDY